MQVEVADVGAEPAGSGQANHGVEVGAVEVHLATGIVHGAADLADRLLEHPVGGGVGDHQGGQVACVFDHLGVEVVEVDVSLVVAADNDHLHARHHRGRGVGAVGRFRDQAHVTRRVPSALVVGADRHQPGQLALAARIGLD